MEAISNSLMFILFIDHDSPMVALYSLLVELRVPRSAHCESGLMDAGSGGVPGFANDTCSVVSTLGSSTTISLRRKILRRRASDHPTR